MPIVPCPAMTSGSSYGCTNVAPRLLLQALAPSSYASEYESPCSTTVAPRASTAATLMCGVVIGMTIVAWQPSRCAASATPCAWLPADAAITPCARSAAVRCAILLYAPRSLNENTSAGPRASAARGCQAGATTSARARAATRRHVVDLRGQDLLQVVDRHDEARLAAIARVGQRRPLTGRGRRRFSASLRAAPFGRAPPMIMLDAFARSPSSASRAPRRSPSSTWAVEQLSPRDRARRGRPDLPPRHRGARRCASAPASTARAASRWPRARPRSRASRASASGCRGLHPSAVRAVGDQYVPRRDAMRPRSCREAEAALGFPDRHHRRPRGGAAHLPRRRARAARRPTSRGS